MVSEHPLDAALLIRLLLHCIEALRQQASYGEGGLVLEREGAVARR